MVDGDVEKQCSINFGTKAVWGNPSSNSEPQFPHLKNGGHEILVSAVEVSN